MAILGLYLRHTRWTGPDEHGPWEPTQWTYPHVIIHTLNLAKRTDFTEITLGLQNFDLIYCVFMSLHIYS